MNRILSNNFSLSILKEEKYKNTVSFELNLISAFHRHWVTGDAEPHCPRFYTAQTVLSIVIEFPTITDSKGNILSNIFHCCTAKTKSPSDGKVLGFPSLPVQT